jgi:uncharacterized protein YndB with AHSA1/START domain
MSSAESLKSIEMSWDLPHAPAKVWRALTEPALVAQWLMPTDFKPELGHRFQFKAQPMGPWDGIIHSEVLVLEPGRKLGYAWRGGPTNLETRVTWTLTATSGGTHLALEHDGFKPSDTFAFAGAGQGWQRNVAERMNAVLAFL